MSALPQVRAAADEVVVATNGLAATGALAKLVPGPFCERSDASLGALGGLLGLAGASAVDAVG